MATRFADHIIGPDTHTNRPAASAVPAGTIYACTTHSKLEQSDGISTWSDYFSGGGGGGAVASDTIWDAKGDLAVGTGADTAAKLTVGANGKIPVAASGETTGIKWDTGYLGGLELVYKYTVTGSDKLSIDTGVDTPDAGTNDWTNGDLLEVYLYGATDEATVLSVVDFIFNNDTTADSYDIAFIDLSTTTVSGNGSASIAAGFQFNIAGASAASGVPGMVHFRIPVYAGTVFNKIVESFSGVVNATGTSRNIDIELLMYESTSALTRIKVAPDTSGKKLKVGSQLLIYKRRNA